MVNHLLHPSLDAGTLDRGSREMAKFLQMLQLALRNVDRKQPNQCHVRANRSSGSKSQKLVKHAEFHPVLLFSPTVYRWYPQTSS
jgi:hypothetical protein